MDNQFRNAAFGGFNRQDVIEYLEKTAAAHAEELARLEDAEQERDELRSQLAAAREELAQTAVSCQTALSASQDQAQRLTELEQENARLRQRLAQAEQDAAAYAALKERTAGMELDAHRRAQAIVDQARAEGQQQRRGVEQWLERLRGEYGEVCAQVNATMANATLELDRARVGLERVTQSLDSKKSALDGLTRTFDSQSHQ